jgi:hypothetical protein
MDSEQYIYYKESLNGEYQFYLLDCREGTYCEIPKEFNGLCMHLKCCKRIANSLAEIFWQYRKVKSLDLLDK